ncbi:MAG: hypothetical protein H7835_20430 [Magnetococcus sp. XQGC-1]
MMIILNVTKKDFNIIKNILFNHYKEYDPYPHLEVKIINKSKSGDVWYYTEIEEIKNVLPKIDKKHQKLKLILEEFLIKEL